MGSKPLFRNLTAILVLLAASAALHPYVVAKGFLTPVDSVRSRLGSVMRDTTGLHRAMSAYRENGDSVAVGMTMAAMGKYYNLRSEYIEAIRWYQQSAAVLKFSGNDREYVNTLVGLATNCRRIGAYSSASEHLFEALNLSERDADKDSREAMRQRSYILNGLGNVYKYLNDGVEAERYFRRSLALDEVIGNELGQSMNWNTIGSIYEYRHEYDSAYVMYHRALEHNLKSGSRNGDGICYNRLGQLAMIQGKVDEAEGWHLKAYDVLSKAGDKWDLAKTTCNLGWIYIEKGRYALAQKYLEESEALVAGNRSYGHLEDIHHNLSELYRRQGDFRRALEESELCRAYQDSSATQRSGQEVAQSRIRYEQERNQIAMDQVVRDREKEVTRRKLILVSATLVVLLLLTLTSFAARYAVLQRKRSEELAQMNAIKNKFFSIISHDLKNPVVSQSRLLDFMVDKFDSLPKESVYEQCKELSRSSASLLDLLTNLLEWARLGAGKIRNEPIVMGLRNTVEEALSPMQEQMRLKGVTVEDGIDPAVTVFADKNIVSSIVRNLVGNAVKFSFEGGTIQVDAEDAGEGEIRVSVTDHGTGIDEERIADLLTIGRETSTRGTAGETGSGLGLIVSREMAELAGGKLSVTSRKGEGSTFSFTIKKTGS